MADSWRLEKTTKKEDGRKIYHYEMDGYTCEIDEVTDGFVIAEANFEYLNEVDTKAETQEELLGRLSETFGC